MAQVTVEREAIEKAVKPRKTLKVCPFSLIVEEMICRGERCQIWDMERGHCQIENLGKIVSYLRFEGES